jgi:hypothetical protein
MIAHLIQFPTEEDYRKAVTALAEVPQTRVGLPEYKMVVTDDHIVQLNRVGIPFTDLTKDVNGDAAPVQP